MSLRVTVQFFAQLGAAAGASNLEVELEEACSAQALVARLAEERGPAFRDLVLDGDGRLQPTVLLFVGEEQVRWDEPVTLGDRDTVLLATPVSGG